MNVDGTELEAAYRVRHEIIASGASVYDPPTTAITGLFYTPVQLEALLNAEIGGRRDLAGLPIKTRSKVAKTLVCAALGYRVPDSFAHTRPRLPHPNVDEFMITELVVTTGADFFSEFRQFGGRVSHSKLQLKLPNEWFG